jgi:hypothetical protein
MISGRQFWPWQTVDSEGEVLDLLVQRLRNKSAAIAETPHLLLMHSPSTAAIGCPVQRAESSGGIQQSQNAPIGLLAVFGQAQAPRNRR